MRVAIVLPPGSRYDPVSPTSMETVVRTMAAHSRNREISIICEGRGDPSDPPGLIRIPEGMTRRARRSAIVSILRALDPDYIEYHQHLADAASIARRFPHKAQTLYRHTRVRPAANPLDRFRYGCRLGTFDRLIFVSRAAGLEFVSDYPDLVDAVSVAPNPIDPARWFASPDQREQLILFAGRASAEKGLDLVCGALAVVLERRPDWRAALMLGDWEQHKAWAEPHVQALARFGDRVEISRSAPLSAVADATRRAAIALTPSRVAEAFGLTAVEAHAGGAALISSGRGGLREASGDHALYVDPSDPDGLSKAIERLIDHPEERLDLARGGQRFVLSAHSAQRRAQELDELRESLALWKAIDLTRRLSRRLGAVSPTPTASGFRVVLPASPLPAPE